MEVFSAGEGKGCSFCFKIPMTRGSGAEESWRISAYNVVDNKIDENRERRSSKSLINQSPRSRLGSNCGVGEGNDMVLSSPRRVSREVVVGPTKSSPTIAMQPLSPMRTPRSAPRQHPMLPHGSDKVMP